MIVEYQKMFCHSNGTKNQCNMNRNNTNLMKHISNEKKQKKHTKYDWNYGCLMIHIFHSCIFYANFTIFIWYFGKSFFLLFQPMVVFFALYWLVSLLKLGDLLTFSIRHCWLETPWVPIQQESLCEINLKPAVSDRRVFFLEMITRWNRRQEDNWVNDTTGHPIKSSIINTM